MDITPREDGRFEVGDRIFPTEAEAKAFADGAAASAQPTEQAKKKSAPLWLQIVVGLGLVYAVMSCVGSKDAPASAPDSAAGATYEEALQKCQSRISMANGALQNVPSTHNRGTGGEFFFLWENANPGGNPPVEASCTVDKKTGRVSSLTLNGKTVM